MEVDLSRERSDSEVGERTLERGDGSRVFLWAGAAMALAGALFAGVSTADFIEHLDRQVHSIHCSFIPGAGEALGESGCRTVMMSPYSSILRTSLWGGLPISLLALAVFAYLTYRGVDFALRGRVTKRETKFWALAWLLPALMSVIYGWIAATKIGATCKLCVGIYVCSALGLFSALLAASRSAPRDPYEPVGGPWTRWFAEGVLFVAVLAGVFVAQSPKSEKSLEGCGALAKRDEPAKIMLPLGGHGTRAVALLDPLCPACRAFDQRLEASGLRNELELDAVLFPLDSSCNWMVKTSLHPGACAVSEAMLCAPEDARDVLAWAFAQQEALTELAKKNERDLRDRIAAQFPNVKGCLGSPRVKNKVNKSLRWAVANALPVLTPQLFIGDRRVCDEDTDLGLEYTVAGMLARRPGKVAR
jgi:uncharacterized membrane protein